jgi:uncharacterized RDD family membrane protein YckC
MRDEPFRPLAPGVTRVPRRAPRYAPYAGFVSRAAAMVIDLLIVGAILLAGGIGADFFVRTSGISQLLGLLADDLSWMAPLRVFLNSASFEIIVTLSVGYFYFTFFYLFGGATIGKYLLGLRVVSADGGRLAPTQAAIRVFAYAASALVLYLGFLAVLVDDQRRGWHDRLSHSAVVYRWQARPDEQFLRKLIERAE